MQHEKGLRDISSHFAFGENWASFAAQVDETSIRFSEESLLKLVTREELTGRKFLDIGCGSGLHAVAACRLGVASIMAIDLDPVSVQTTRELMNLHAPADFEWKAETTSVFDLDPARHGLFDVVYSWGVLHHTGDMYGAMAKAADMVAPGGLFAFALYRRTNPAMDRFWTWEKRWYTNTSQRMQTLAQNVFVAVMRAGYRLRGRSFATKAAEYSRQRGNEIAHDIHDWLGGYPYEVISPAEVATEMKRLGFVEVRSFTRPGGIGLLGSGCDEYVYRRVA
jgi:2-polyprenyl-6-hydroxyphenyl methylase/3-demethylubiquinone-9 3-methyltransferase